MVFCCILAMKNENMARFYFSLFCFDADQQLEHDVFEFISLTSCYASLSVTPAQCHITDDLMCSAQKSCACKKTS